MITFCLIIIGILMLPVCLARLTAMLLKEVLEHD